MMVTVAKSLDVPIKLMFPRPAAADDLSGIPSHAMLGLGDIVLPGMIGLALRFDLYLFYLRRQKRIPSIKEGGEDTVEKPQYFSLAGRWSDHFWTHSLFGRPLWVASTAQDSKPEAPFTFPKTYFTAAMVGYVLGLFATLGVMMIWNHAQPALLYLVPGVLGSLWLTALVRGETDLMWNYTEDIAEDEKSKEKKKAGEKEANGTEKEESAGSSDKGNEEKESDEVNRVSSRRPEREVFAFSIEAPWKVKDTKAVRKSEKEEKHNWAPVVKGAADTEQAEKRVRLK
jgi:minor histocompatibility antigen H13